MYKVFTDKMRNLYLRNENISEQFFSAPNLRGSMFQLYKIILITKKSIIIKHHLCS
jgi:hypothetical protein